MDIARNPATPDGNIALADAPREPNAPRTIRREDYTPPPWLVPTIELDFDLGLERTHVTATLRLERNPQAKRDNTVRLNGDGLELERLECDDAPCSAYRMDGDDLLVSLEGDAHTLTIETVLDPSANSQLMGLYASNGALFTQCEAEGFRRITFFPDRPDVLSIYTVRMEGDATKFPVLLSNGNLTDAGEETDGRHFAEWHDPWPKPSYLFALVAGDLQANSGSFTTTGGREVELNIWVRAEDIERTDHALESLINSMRWDEEAFGREYDLDVYNIVAVSDFNMGAMENKGLNVFNTKYVLADEETATDGDFDAVESVIGHEYFHNWSGNRVTCRDWFQLSLKEGFTVLRDQLFSQAMGSAPVKRIADVRVLRGVQFPEDSGPLAHPIRPDSYQEISNFYTATVYNKGAEVIRMMRTMAGEERFRKGCDLYFDTHDGEAATCEDFVKAIEDGAGLDLEQFRLWYSQAGTPKIEVLREQDGDDVVLTFRQTVPPTPGQDDKRPMPVPLATAIFDTGSGEKRAERLIVVADAEHVERFEGVGSACALSVNRDFSAPVRIERHTPPEELRFLAVKDDNPFARYEALQNLAVNYLVGDGEGDGYAAIEAAIEQAISDDGIDDMMRGELLMLPSQTYLMEQVAKADPAAIFEAREGLKRDLGKALGGQFEQLHQRCCAASDDRSVEAKGARKVKTIALTFLAAAEPERASELAKTQYDEAANMTDRQGALMVLTGLPGAARTQALMDFYSRFKGNALVIDKWFALQASSLHPQVVEHVKALADHPDFTLRNPNRVRSLYMAFAGNPHAFHADGGEGYRMIADLILELDPINPQTAARFVPPLGRWRRIEPGRAEQMKAALERIAKADGLSRDTYEQVTRSLG